MTEDITISLSDLISLIDSPSDTFAKERQYLNEHTCLGNWGHILPPSVATQIMVRDEQGSKLRIIPYDTPTGVIWVGITPFGLKHSGELRRLAQERMRPEHSARALRRENVDACQKIIQSVITRLQPRIKKAHLDPVMALVRNRAEQCKYDPHELEEFVNELLPKK